jgi:hypothetical protein
MVASRAVKYDRLVVGYHGCDVEVADRVLAGERFALSENDYDWLGSGTYFWEYGADRALAFAQAQLERGRINAPTVVGALIQLGQCFDLMDTRYTRLVSKFFPVWKLQMETARAPLPRNEGKAPDNLLRRLDCAVLNWLFDFLKTETGEEFDTVRCAFAEGNPIFDGSRIHEQSHIQIAVRNTACIVGVFRPTG